MNVSTQDPVSSPDEDDTAAGSGGRPGRATVVGLGVLVTVLAVVVVWLAAVWQDGRAAEDDRAAAVSAARQAVLTMTTVDPVRAVDSFRQLTESATGGFAQQLQSQSEGFVQGVQQAGVISRSTITESGFVEGDDQRATVLVSADSVVQNAQVPDGEPRQYRMVLTMAKRGDAGLVAGLACAACGPRWPLRTGSRRARTAPAGCVAGQPRPANGAGWRCS